ncbi:MAG: hypothetical protein QM676_14305 [Novosphingobium sp.]
MTVGAQAAASDAARDWEAVRGTADIQFAPVQPAPPAKPPEVPDWLMAFGEWLGKLFSGLGKWFGIPWPVFEKILIGLAAVGVLILLWVLIKPLLARLSQPRPEAEPEWAPDRAEALALLEDADRLAAAGKFDEATHLLLKRSVGQIAQARPDWLSPASTAREIAGILALPAVARAAFATIAGRVEASRYALRPLGSGDWDAARKAYADFALQDIGSVRIAA